ncbi:hypothetical protein ACI3PL_33015, partial [Lacticaseibacillus paracasei]
ITVRAQTLTAFEHQPTAANPSIIVEPLILPRAAGGFSAAVGFSAANAFSAAAAAAAAASSKPTDAVLDMVTVAVS